MTDTNERIKAALSRLGAEHEPPLGWEARVLAAVGAKERRRWWWWVYAAPGVALAAAAAIALVVLRPPPALALNVDIKHSVRVRGDEASVGDVLHITASGGKAPRVIRVYHEEDQLVLSCPGDPKCRVSDASTEVDLTVRSAGSYTVVALTAADNLPAPAGSYDADTAAAKDAGIAVHQYQLTVH